MSPIKSHEEVSEMLPAAALGILDPAELESVVAHVRECQECGKLLQEYREVAAALSLQLPSRGLDPVRGGAVRARLVTRAHTDKSTSGTDQEAGVLLSHSRAATLIYRWSGWMVAAGLASVLLVHHSVHRPLDHGWLAAGALVVAVFGLGLYARVQRSRVAALEGRLASLGASLVEGERSGSPVGPSSATPGHDLTAA